MRSLVVNLLLLLSALLSALTGVGSVARAAPVAQSITAQATVVATCVSAIRIAHRPIQPLAALARVSVMPIAVLPMLGTVALYASRRRE